MRPRGHAEEPDSRTPIRGERHWASPTAERVPRAPFLDVDPGGRYNVRAMWMGRAACASVHGPSRGPKGRFNPFEFTASGFTLTELMVVVVLVGILAAVAVPVYDRYIRQTKASEARAMIGAIVAAEKAYAERNGVFVAASTPQDFLDKLKIDIKESGLFDYAVSGVSGKDRFTVTATVNSEGVSQGLPSGGTVVYQYDRNREPRGQWQENL